MATLPDLDSLLTTLRAKGVKSYRADDDRIELEFFPAVEVVAAERPGPSVPPADICRCGHPEHAHMNGLCVVGGCDPSQCAPPEAK